MKVLRNAMWSAVAMALMAAVFASAASASETETVLCKAAPEGAFCPPGKTLPEKTSFSAELKIGTKLTYTSYWPTSCSKVSLKGETTSMQGEPLTATIESIGIGDSCGVSCWRSFEGHPWPVQMQHTTEGDGTLTMGDKSHPVILHELNCNSPYGGNCYYEANSITLGFDGGSPATLVSNKQLLTLNKGKSVERCGSGNVYVSATFTLQSPAAAYLTAPEEE